jgi:hypothetical protein
MRHLEVLVFTKNTTTVRILNWQVSIVNNVETAIEKLQQRPYKVLAISKQISELETIKLQQLAPVLFNNVIVVEYAEDSTLEEKIKTAYWSKNSPRVERVYLDNSFAIKLANSLN